MTELTLKIEILIDRFLLYLPSELFVKAPFLTALLADPNGRYVLSGVAVVTGLIGLWIFFSFLQLLSISLFRSQRLKSVQNHDDLAEQKNNQLSDGFQFFQRREVQRSADNSKNALKMIEQEMLGIRQKFSDGLVLKDVYVSETQRLYIEAKKLKA